MRTKIDRLRRLKAYCRLFVPVIAGCLLVLFAAPSVTAKPAALPFCGLPADSIAQWFLLEMKNDASTTDAGAIKLRTTLALPNAVLTSIIPITDESKCSRASRAIDSVHVGITPGSAVYLVQFGTHYMALAPGSVGLIAHLDNLFTYKNGIVQQ